MAAHGGNTTNHVTDPARIDFLFKETFAHMESRLFDLPVVGIPRHDAVCLPCISVKNLQLLLFIDIRRHRRNNYMKSSLLNYS
jgi:hypothetical protein